MYTLDDCLMVRKTDIFPKNGVIRTPVHDKAYSFFTSLILGKAIIRKIRESTDNTNAIVERSKDFYLYYETYRSTISFAINGIVQDSIFGKFNYPFAIIEPLKYHINDDSLQGLRVEDTYFNDDITLSNNSIILVPQSALVELNNLYDLTGLNIRTYTGNLDDAIKQIFEELNYPFFQLCNNGYVDGLDENTPQGKMYNFISSYAYENDIQSLQLSSTDLYFEDNKKKYEASLIVEKKYINYILDSGLVRQDLVEKIRNYVDYINPDYKNDELEEALDEMINELGLPKIEELTYMFNQQMLKEREESLDPQIR